MIVHRDIEQGSEAWHKIRAGIPTSSNFNKIMTPQKEMKAKWDNYLYTLAGERLLGITAESFESSWMTRGKALEAEAREVYSMTNEVEVEQVGFIASNDGLYGCSPDGLMVGKGLEVKCPAIHTHVFYMLQGVLPTDYKLQVQGSMLITGFMEWDFFSYYPGLPAFAITVKRDNELLVKLKVLLDDFCSELDEVEKELRGL